MDADKVRLTKEHETYLSTLYGKALDARAENPILGDTFADDVVRRIDFDFGKLNLPEGGSITLPMRAKHLDSWAREFLDTHPASTGTRCFFITDYNSYSVDYVNDDSQQVTRRTPHYPGKIHHLKNTLLSWYPRHRPARRSRPHMRLH